MKEAEEEKKEDKEEKEEEIEEEEEGENEKVGLRNWTHSLPNDSKWTNKIQHAVDARKRRRRRWMEKRRRGVIGGN